MSAPTEPSRAASARRYIVVVQAAEGYPHERGTEEAPCPPEPIVHTAVLVDAYEPVESIVRALAAVDMPPIAEDACRLCGGPDSAEHDDDCPWVRARAWAEGRSECP